MRFLLDQSTDARLIPFLVERGHDAIRIGKDYPGGLPDPEVLAIARRERRILITDDRDFGELVVRQRLRHSGVIFLRLGDSASLATKIERVAHVLAHHRPDLTLGQYLIVTQARVRTWAR